MKGMYLLLETTNRQQQSQMHYAESLNAAIEILDNDPELSPVAARHPLWEYVLIPTDDLAKLIENRRAKHEKN